MGKPQQWVDGVFGLSLHPWGRDPDCKAREVTISAVKEELQEC